MALGRRPPALYLDGRWSLTTYITGLFLPRSLVDIFATIFFGCWKLTTWWVLCAVSLPRSLVDVFATIFFGCWKLTTWCDFGFL